jgi:hypothetical protein
MKGESERLKSAHRRNGIGRTVLRGGEHRTAAQPRPGASGAIEQLVLVAAIANLLVLLGIFVLGPQAPRA